MTVARWLTLALALMGFGFGLFVGQRVGRVEAQGGAPGSGRPPASAPPHVHGTPKGWRFAWPPGNAAKGREVFRKLECYSCHEVRGERFPAPTDPSRVGPELSAMG